VSFLAVDPEAYVAMGELSMNTKKTHYGTKHVGVCSEHLLFMVFVAPLSCKTYVGI